MSELFSGTGEGLARLGLEILGKGSSAISGELRQRWFNASGQYIANYKKRHCQLKVLGMRDPVDLARVYTSVKFLGDDDILKFESIAALEESYRETRFRGYVGKRSDGEKRSGIQVANEHQYLMVLGGPGAGKSTFLRKIGLESLKTLHYENADYTHRRVPVLLELKRFEADGIDITSLISKEFEICDFPEPENFVQSALKQGKLLILLDGLDEVPTANLDNVIRTIQDFVDRYDKNRFIASCRTAAYRGGFTRFSDVGMADFDDEQIEQFIGNWFSSEQDIERETGEKCWEILQKDKNEAAKELAHTPLLLTFLCLVYDRSQRFPANRSRLYQRALRILLEEWAAEKRINRDEIYEGLSIELEEQLLSEIAYDGFEADQLFFTKRELTKQIKEFLASNLNVPKALDGEAVLQAIEVQQGVLVERTEDAYSFSHLTLQEYLTAQYLVDNNQWISVINSHANNIQWREVLLLIPGLLSGKQGANMFLETLANRANECLASDKLKSWLEWSTSITQDSRSDLTDIQKRIHAIALPIDLMNTFSDLLKEHSEKEHSDDENIHWISSIYSEENYTSNKDHLLGCYQGIAQALHIEDAFINCIGIFRAIAKGTRKVAWRMINHAENFDNSNVLKTVNWLELYQTIKKLDEQHKSLEDPLAAKKQYERELLDVWFLNLKLKPHVLTLSNEEVIALADYFYIYTLVIQCKEAAVRVSPDAWADIESRILTVPEE